MHRIFREKAYEMEHGPHFNEEKARKAVSKMENEDGTRGAHWSLEETTALANQYGINLNHKFNRYDWFVALNMVYSDYYKVMLSITNSNSTKNFVEFAKAWLNDKDIEEGKMWYYYIYVMCDKIRDAEMECYEEEVSKRGKYEEDDEDEYEHAGLYRRGGRRGGMYGRRVYGNRYDVEREEYDKLFEKEREREYDPYTEYGRSRATRYVRY
jgi:hypothetical protein